MDVRRLTELGMPGELAKELVSQINAAIGGISAPVTSVNGATGAVVLDASDIAFTPAGDIAATNVQAAIEELDTEKTSA